MMIIMMLLGGWGCLDITNVHLGYVELLHHWNDSTAACPHIYAERQHLELYTV